MTSMNIMSLSMQIIDLQFTKKVVLLSYLFVLMILEVHMMLLLFHFSFLSLGKYIGDETAMCIQLGLLCCRENNVIYHLVNLLLSLQFLCRLFVSTV